MSLQSEKKTKFLGLGSSTSLSESLILCRGVYVIFLRARDCALEVEGRGSRMPEDEERAPSMVDQ